MTSVRIEPFSAEAFAPYGHAFDAPEADKARTDRRVPLVNARPHAAANLAAVRASVIALPAVVTPFERHVHSSQLFVPLDVESYLVLVAPGGDEGPDLTKVRAFRVPGTTAICYAPRTWHAGMRVLGGRGTFAMHVHEDGTAEDTDFRDVSVTVTG